MSDEYTYLLQLLGNLVLSIYCGGMMYQTFVETPSKLCLDINSKIKSLDKCLDACKIYLPIFLLPGIILPMIRYFNNGHIFFLIGSLLSSLIFPISILLLFKDYEQVKRWANDPKTNYRKKEFEMNTTLHKIRCIHAFKSLLCFISLILFIRAGMIEFSKLKLK